MDDPLLRKNRPTRVENAQLVERATPVDTGEQTRWARVLRIAMILIWHHQGLLQADATLALAGLVGTSSRRSTGAAPAGRCKARHRPGRTGLHLDLEGNMSEQVLTETARVTGGTIPPPPWWTDQVWTVVNGHTLPTTSGSPFRPSQTRKNTSVTPRFFRSVSTANQNFAPSPPVPAHSPRRPSPRSTTPRSQRRSAGSPPGRLSP